jgi:predicted nucleic acid-binding protein
MSKLVADSCVVLKWLIDEPGTPAARQILNAYGSQEWLQLLAPDRIYPEVSNVLWKKARRQLITADEAWQAFEVFRRYEFVVTASADLLEEAMQIAFDHDQSPYDRFYVALSQREGCPLVTADETLVRKVSGAFPQVVLLGSLP